MAFGTREELWEWLRVHHQSHAGAWVRLQKTRSPVASVTFHDLLEAGIAFGWSESTRLPFDSLSYLQKFTPRRKHGTTSARNMRIAERLAAEARMTAAGWLALGRPCSDEGHTG